VEKMSATVRKKIDASRYRKLVSEVAPMVIETEEQNERTLEVIEALLKKGEKRTPEEDAILNLLACLVEQFEARAYPIPADSPAQTIEFLLGQRGLKPIALQEVLGSRGRVSEVLSGKRSVSKEQAKKLAEFFHVGVELFI
jgi:HTH-type transcriptional regulator/antitoxin HigA